MATALNRFSCLALRYTCQIPSRRKPFVSVAVPYRPRFGSTRPVPPKKDDLESTKLVPRNKYRERDNLKPPKDYTFSFNSLTPSSRDYYNSLSPEQKEEYVSSSKKLHELMSSPAVESKLHATFSDAVSELSREVPDYKIPIPRVKLGFFNRDMDDVEGMEGEEEFEGDDITSLGHGELEQHRELREYARIAAWDMPLLSKLAKPFSPPPLDHPLRFRYTTYMGEEHPAAEKIVLEFCTRDLPDLTEGQRIKLIKLVGPRYNPETDIVKMSCEMFETQAQNKRYLGDLVDTLMTEAKDSTDMFEDVPLDFRHHKYKPKKEFPEAWKMTPERKQRMETNRQQDLLAEREKEEKGQIADGVQVIEAMLKARPAPQPSVILVPGKKQKGKATQGRTIAR